MGYVIITLLFLLAIFGFVPMFVLIPGVVVFGIYQAFFSRSKI